MAPSEVDLSMLSRAYWFTQHKRRWPLCLMVFVSAALSIYAIMVGRGRVLAHQNLPRSTQAIIAAQPKPVPETENAAVVWRQAMNALPNREGAKTKDATSPDMDWRNPAPYGAASEERKFLADNANALALADQAASLPQVNWCLDYTKGTQIPIPHCSKMRHLARVVLVRAKVAAHDNDWPLVLKSLNTAIVAGEHVAADKMLVCCLVQVAIESVTAFALEEVLAVPGANINQDLLNELKALSKSRYQSRVEFADGLRLDRLLILNEMDKLGCGMAKPSSMGEVWVSLPFLFSWYSAVYPDDREFYDAQMTQLAADVAEAQRRGNLRQIERGRCEKAAIRARERFLPMSSTLIPVFERAPESDMRCRLQWRLAYIALNALEYRARHDGQWPKGLEEFGLGPALLVSPLYLEDSTIHTFVAPDQAFWLWCVNDRHSAKLPPAKDLADKKKLWSWRGDNTSFCAPAVKLSGEVQ